MWAIIGGSGFEKFEQFQNLEDLVVETPFGNTSGLKRMSWGQKQFLFVSRHGPHHELTPSEINYRANIFALKKMGARWVISISAVGSLKKQLRPGDLVIPNQYLDRTKGIRPHTFCGGGLVGHVSLAHPTSVELQSLLSNYAADNFDIHFKKTYVCIEGPAFSTRAESKNYCEQGADIIGMTHFPEYALAREAGLAYLPCCFVTDYDCWDEEIQHVTLSEVVQIMKQNNQKAFGLVTHLLKISDSQISDISDKGQGLAASLLTLREHLSSAQKELMSVLGG